MKVTSRHLKEEKVQAAVKEIPNKNKLVTELELYTETSSNNKLQGVLKCNSASNYI